MMTMMMATSQMRRQRRTPCEPSCSVAAADHLLLRPSVRCDVEVRVASGERRNRSSKGKSSQVRVNSTYSYTSRSQVGGLGGIRRWSDYDRQTSGFVYGQLKLHASCAWLCCSVRVCVSSGTFALLLVVRSHSTARRHQTNEKHRIAFSGTNGTQSHPVDMIETITSIDPLDKESHRYQQESNPAAADFDPKKLLKEKIPVFDEIVKVPAAPPKSYFGAAPRRRLSESGTTMTTSGSYNHLISLEGSGSGEEGISHAQSADAEVAVAPPAPAGADSSSPARPVAKRANSLGHLATDLDSTDNSDQPKQMTTTRGLLQKLGSLRRHTMQHHRSNSAGDVLDVSGRGGDMNTTRPTSKPSVPAPTANRKPKAVPARFHHRCTMEDSIHVQIRHNQVLDDEEHEENPHLQDYLKPKQFVHMSKRESQDNLLHLETQYLRPKVKPMVVAEEESSDEENENENDDPLPSASAAANVVDADVAAGTAADADEVSVERTEVHDEPITAVAHKKCDPNEPLRSCMKKAWGQDTEPRKPKRNVIFHEVTVRDYGITLGGTFLLPSALH